MVSNTRLLDQHAELPNNFLAYVQGKFVISLVPPSAPLLFIINNVLTFFARMPHFTYIFLFWTNLHPLLSRCYSKNSMIADHLRRKIGMTAEPIISYVKQLRQSWSI